LIFTEWKKAPEALVEFIIEKMKSKKGDYRKMFGYPAYFINGNMFVGVHGENLFIRLSDGDLSEIMKACKDVVPFEPMAGRAMKGYVVIPESIYCDDRLFAVYLDKSIDYVSSLPAKRKSEKKH
jgi:TfoX/Sxy family transcriptional regulator of competence genes